MASDHYYLYDETDCLRFRVEGSFSDAQARDLEHSRRTASSVIGGRPWVLTLGNVIRIEPLGRALLRRWSREGVRIAGNSPLLKSIARSMAGETVASASGPDSSPSQAWEEYVDSVLSGIESGTPRRAPPSSIRHYSETVFVPGSTLSQALRPAPDFGPHECESCTVRVDDRHAYRVAGARRVQGIREFASVIRRLLAITHFRERDGGVSIEMEAIALACNVPTPLRWLAEPLVRSLSPGSLSASLHQMASAAGQTKPRAE